MLESELPVKLNVFADYVNSQPNSTWTAYENDKFKGAKYNQVKSLMGTVVDPVWTVKMLTRKEPVEITDSFPSDFDARTFWPEC